MIFNKRSLHLLCIAAAVSLAGCKTATIQGKVIDGYISGATVWLDLDADGELGEFEPTAVSTAGGNYQFELDEIAYACLLTLREHYCPYPRRCY